MPDNSIRSDNRTVPSNDHDPVRLEKIVSGGQTGVDRAALDAARALGIETGGWCPRGRRAEDGRIPEQYPLQETDGRSYAIRTEWNVRDSDGTLIIALDEISSGTRLTIEAAKSLGKPLKVAHLRPGSDTRQLLTDSLTPSQQIDDITRWVRKHQIRVLNVAGPRGSSSPLMYPEAFEFLTLLLKRMPADVLPA